MSRALPKNPILICTPSFSIKLAKSKFRMKLLMRVWLKFDKIEDTHIISKFWEVLFFHCSTDYFPNGMPFSYRFRIWVVNIIWWHSYLSHSFIFSDFGGKFLINFILKKLQCRFYGAAVGFG